MKIRFMKPAKPEICTTDTEPLPYHEMADMSTFYIAELRAYLHGIIVLLSICIALILTTPFLISGWCFLLFLPPTILCIRAYNLTRFELWLEDITLRLTREMEIMHRTGVPGPIWSQILNKE